MRLRPIVSLALVVTGLASAAVVAMADEPGRPSATIVSPLFAAVLPSSRSVLSGAPATAFATVINAGGAVAQSVGISLGPAIPAELHFRTTDCLTNQVTGDLDVPVDIAPGEAQCFVFAIFPTLPFPPQVLPLIFAGPQTAPAASIAGVNTLLLSSNTAVTPDVVAVSATIGNDGTVLVPSTTGIGVFGVAVSNVGASGQITVVASTDATALPVSIGICQTNVFGFCMQPPAASVTIPLPGLFDTGVPGVGTFGVFVAANGPIVFDPAVNRVFVRFTDPGNVTRGSTSVAVRTP